MAWTQVSLGGEVVPPTGVGLLRSFASLRPLSSSVWEGEMRLWGMSQPWPRLLPAAAAGPSLVVAVSRVGVALRWVELPGHCKISPVVGLLLRETSSDNTFCVVGLLCSLTP